MLSLTRRAPRSPLNLVRGYAQAAVASRNATHPAELPQPWQGTRTDGGATKYLSNGEWLESKTDRHVDVNDPSTQQVLTRVPEMTHAEMTSVVDGAQTAFESWRDSSVLKRQDVMLK